ncbi:hypothetical protein SIN8267_02115 [Sinobacterium norvegicum]|uniref:HTH tetR-type domain-containing protein n=1 Tax=Sinobacterium norvegicum TaxID=1641715 RepID=A0ABN8EI01_9GAMM|nr:TetR family transcriptional regulator [Sinobacterium norvegicum]CAH0992000.1 hypothetical protein SIN8267_02115 [Sinobacterium norvegicum]
MARKSAAEAARTKQKITDAIIQLTIHEGFEVLSYTRLSKETGVSRSGIANHFPDKRSMVEVFQGQIFTIFTRYLDMTTVESFQHSWMNSLASDEFRNIILLVFVHMGTSANPAMNVKAVMGVNRLTGFVEGSLGQPGVAELESLLGRTLLSVIMRNKSNELA